MEAGGGSEELVVVWVGLLPCELGVKISLSNGKHSLLFVELNAVLFRKSRVALGQKIKLEIPGEIGYVDSPVSLSKLSLESLPIFLNLVNHLVDFGHDLTSGSLV